MNILMLSNDLMFPSRVAALARTHGHTLQTCATTAALSTAIGEIADLALLIVDLGTPGCDTGDIVSQLRERVASARVVAFAPHVKTGLLDAARQAGCDEVLTQGQFDRRLNQLLAE